MQQPPLKNIIEAILLAAARPMTVNQLLALLADEPLEAAPAEEAPEAEEGPAAEGAEAAEGADGGVDADADEGEDEAAPAPGATPERDAVRQALAELAEDYEGRGFELKEVASGFRIQVREACAPWVSRLWDERPPRYSRALLETLALIAYRQPITRAEIEDIRGVVVSSNIVKTLLEREWVRVVGHKELPGRPAMYATTRQFLDYFNLKSLAELPTLAELRDLERISAELVEQGVIEPEPEQPLGDAPEPGLESGAESGAESKPEAGPESGSQLGSENHPAAEEPPSSSDERGEVGEPSIPDAGFDAEERVAGADAPVGDAEQTEADKPTDELNGIDPSEEGV